MTTIVDSSVLIDLLRGDPGAQSTMREAAVAGERLVASVLTKVEVLAGMRPAEEHATLALFAQLDWVGVDEALAERAGMLANHYVRSYPGIDPVDYVIAATTEQLDANLWTRNTKHFPMFGDLQPPY